MSQAGWFPDPGGQPGMFRYWDGQVWSDDVTPTPGQTGGQAYGQPTAPGYPAYSAYPQNPQTAGSFASTPTLSGPQGADAFRARATTPVPRKAPVGAIMAVVATLVILGILAFVFLRAGGATVLPGGPKPTAVTSEDVCPKSTVQTSARQHPSDGRVHGGSISFPRQSAPWTAPAPDTRVPFGADVHEQTYPVEPNYDKTGADWVAALLVGDLVAGDGFYGAHEGADIVAKCVIGLFYGDNKVERKDIKSEAHPVGGKDGWLIQMHLSFDIPGLKCKGETATIVVISTGTSSSSLYYSSIPDTTPQLMAVQDSVLADLRVHE